MMPGRTEHPWFFGNIDNDFGPLEIVTYEPSDCEHGYWSNTTCRGTSKLSADRVVFTFHAWMTLIRPEALEVYLKSG